MKRMFVLKEPKDRRKVWAFLSKHSRKWEIYFVFCVTEHLRHMVCSVLDIISGLGDLYMKPDMKIERYETESLIAFWSSLSKWNHMKENKCTCIYFIRTKMIDFYRIGCYSRLPPKQKFISFIVYRSTWLGN